MRRSFVSTALLLLGMASPLFANSPAQSPYWTGRLEQDTTWRDTVYVGGDVTIAVAATLTLAPNTKVLFLPYRDEIRGGLDTTRAELVVEGQLHAQAGGIVFRSADAGSLGADWYGLVIERGGRADVSNAVIRDGLRCVYAKMGGFVTMDALVLCQLREAERARGCGQAGDAGGNGAQRRAWAGPSTRNKNHTPDEPTIRETRDHDSYQWRTQGGG